LPFYHGIFSALFYFITVRHRRGIASGGLPLAQGNYQLKSLLSQAPHFPCDSDPVLAWVVLWLKIYIPHNKQ
jgi:hypothetical protein